LSELEVALLIHSLVLCLQMMISVIYFSYFIANRVANSRNETLDYVPWLIHHCLGIVMSASLVLVQTWWVLYKLKRKNERERQRHRTQLNANPLPSTSGMDTIKAAAVVDINLSDVIREPIGFESFMNHLGKEFSTENLLAIIEFAQYKARFAEIDQMQTVLANAPESPVQNKIITTITRVIKSFSPREQVGNDDNENDDGDDNNDENEEPVPQSQWNENTNMSSDGLAGVPEEETLKPIEHEPDIKLPNNLPFSSIVYGAYYSDNNEQEKEKAFMQNVVLREWAIDVIRKLYDKYIVVGTELELNLSGRVRARCFKTLDAVDDLNKTELYHIFDKCMESVMKLMQDSYARFQTTKEFIRCEDKAQKRKHDSSKITGDALGFDLAFTNELE